MEKAFVRLTPDVSQKMIQYDKLMEKHLQLTKKYRELQLSLVNHCMVKESYDQASFVLNAYRLGVLRRVFRVLVDPVFAAKLSHERWGGNDVTHVDIYGNVKVLTGYTQRDAVEKAYRLDGPSDDGRYMIFFSQPFEQFVAMTLPEMRAIINFYVPRMFFKELKLTNWYKANQVWSWEQEPVTEIPHVN